MAVTLVEKKLLVPKESAELVDALSSILKDVLAGKKVNAVTDNLGKLIAAAQGINEVLVEVKSKNIDDLAAYLTKTMTESLYKGAQGDEIDTKNL